MAHDQEERRGRRMMRLGWNWEGHFITKCDNYNFRRNRYLIATLTTQHTLVVLMKEGGKTVK